MLLEIYQLCLQILKDFEDGVPEKIEEYEYIRKRATKDMLRMYAAANLLVFDGKNEGLKMRRRPSVDEAKKLMRLIEEIASKNKEAMLQEIYVDMIWGVQECDFFLETGIKVV